MLFVVLLIGLMLLIGVIVVFVRRVHTDRWSSSNWNTETKRFQHSWHPNMRILSLKVVLQYMKEPRTPWPKHVPISAQPCIKQRSQQLLITNIGHATFLVQMANLNILTDPVFSQRAAPLQWLGPKRVVNPGVSITDLPTIDIVFISHNHYDHLDKSSVLYLAKAHPVTFVVPLGVQRQLRRWGIKSPIVELDWWQAHLVGKCKIVAVPAQHWSRRGIFDMNKTLWMGGIIESNDFSVFFAGDTGFGKHFSDIKERFERIDVGLLPIGSYKPRAIMKHQHMDPKEGIAAHQLLNTRYMIPIHYDVFPLGKEKYLEAEHDLIEEVRRLAVPAHSIKLLKVGEQFQLPASADPQV